MKKHEGLVHAFIRRQGGGELSYEEALQAGRIGLWHAIEGYDPKRGTRFATYAWVAISRQIRRRARELQRERDIEILELPLAEDVSRSVEELDRELAKEALCVLVNQLPPRLREVIIGRYGLGKAPPYTLRKLGEELGLSGERVRQLQQDALAWLRHPAHSWPLRQMLDKNTAADYRKALAQNAALRRSRRRVR
jgi:RNA polymerase sigma factor (sigma-70 family)